MNVLIISSTSLISLREWKKRNPRWKPCNLSDDEIIRKEKLVIHDYVSLRTDEESFSKQRARINWINLEDMDSKFFFKAMKSFRSHSKIATLAKDDGSLVT